MGSGGKCMKAGTKKNEEQEQERKKEKKRETTDRGEVRRGANGGTLVGVTLL
jgi:hypothetical protein